MQKPSLRRQIITFLRICNTGLHNLFRNAWLTTAAIAVMTVTLTIVVSALVANFALQEAIDSVAKNLTISVFLEDEAPQQDQDALKANIESQEYVDSVNYKSKQEALEDFQERFQDKPELLEGLAIAEDNVFPASFEIVLNDINKYEEITMIASSEEFDAVVLQTSDNEQSRDSFNGFIATRRSINQVSIVLGLIFGSISILVIFNTIRMAIFTRSNEIEIMKLIGATPGYIRGPYLFEASMYGVIAALISISIIYPISVKLARQFLEGVAGDYGSTTINTVIPGGVVNFFTEYWYVVGALVIGAGILIGFVSSVVAMAKYLRLKRW